MIHSHINTILAEDAEIRITEEVRLNEGLFIGQFQYQNNHPKQTVDFSLEIPGNYPYGQCRFLPENIDGFPHQYESGAICLPKNPDDNLTRKFKEELQNLKTWVNDYFIKEKNDPYPEYLLPVSLRDNIEEYRRMMFDNLLWGRTVPVFTAFPQQFDVGDCGYCRLNLSHQSGITNFMHLSQISNKKRTQTVFPIHAVSKGQSSIPSTEGVWLYLDELPVSRNRKRIERFDQLLPILTSSQLSFLKKVKKEAYRSNTDKILSKLKKLLDTYRYTPIDNIPPEELTALLKSPFFVTCLIGYPLKHHKGTEIQWDSILLPIDKNYPLPKKKKQMKQSIQSTNKVRWMTTHNIDYARFFGRGKLSDRLTKKRILILGIGAIGSHLSEMLVRGGQKQLTLCDIDSVEAGNICRSGYYFNDLEIEKNIALRKKLHEISPFVTVTKLQPLQKVQPLNRIFKQQRSILEAYDMIFDCTTDMELAHWLDQADLSIPIINLSITNTAKELVCITGRNITSNKHRIFSELQPAKLDLYEETGCSDPTFRASGVDILSLLSFALRNLNLKLERNGFIPSFIVRTKENETGMLDFIFDED